MLCPLSKSSFAVLPPSHDTLTFVDANSNISRVDSGTRDGRLLGYRNKEDSVLVWSTTSNELKVRKIDSAEETIATIKDLVSLTRFGEDGYCAYCEEPETGSIIVLRGEKLDDRVTVLTRKRKVVDKSEAGPTAYTWTAGWSCALVARKAQIYVVRGRKGVSDLEKLYSFKSRFEVVSLAVSFTANGVRSGDVTICAGSSVGKIALHRIDETTTFSPVTSELHWHSGIVRTLSLVDENHMISGGNEGVLVLWRLDRGTSSTTFRPRLGASIIDSCVLASQLDDGESQPTNCLLLLSDGCTLEFEVPLLTVVRRIRTWIPNNSLCAAPIVLNATSAASRYLAVALDNHRPGALTFIDADLRDSTVEEHIVDVAGRNAVSTAEKHSQWSINEVRFSPDGKFFASLLSSGAGSFRKLELRIFQKEVEVLRVPMALGHVSEANTSPRRCSYLATTTQSVAVVDPNAPGKVILFVQPQNNGEFSLDRVFDVDPHQVICVALSDDESCIGALMNQGLVRIWSRINGQVVLSHGISNPSKEGGIGFSRKSREIFVWSSSGVDALLSQWRLKLPGLVFGSVSPVLDTFVYIVDEGGSRTVFTWMGGDNEPVKVDAIEPQSDWQQIEWAGSTIGWLLRRGDGSLHTRGGEHSFVPKRLSEAKIPGIKLYKHGQVALKPLEVNGTVAHSSLVGVEWCKDLPSHLLPRPPPVDLVWPTVEPRLQFLPKANSAVALTQKPANSSSSSKRRKQLLGREEEIDSSEAAIEMQTEEERELFVSAFRSANGKTITKS